MKYFSKIFKLALVLFATFISTNNISDQTRNFDDQGSKQLITLQPARYKIPTWGAHEGRTRGDLKYNSGSRYNASVASSYILFSNK